MTVTYHLTSPYMEGPHVKVIQEHMKKDGYYHGSIDGVYGILTAQAVYKAKFWLGYPKPDKVAGDVFYAYLTGKRKPTLGMRRTSANRKKAATHVPLRVKMLAEAMRHVGVKEEPANSNRNPFGLWYGANGVPWCAQFVSYCGSKAGSKAFVKGKSYAYVPYVVNDARAGRNHLAITLFPLPGDLVCYDWPGESKGLADHIGIFLHWNDEKHSMFTAVEGNTSLTNNSNGGQVMIRATRLKTEVLAFVHVGG